MPPEATTELTELKLGAPATRALRAAGYQRLGDVAEADVTGLAELHGVGPRAIGLLRQALDEAGLEER
jgi:hypothetical protein